GRVCRRAGTRTGRDLGRSAGCADGEPGSAGDGLRCPLAEHLCRIGAGAGTLRGRGASGRLLRVADRGHPRRAGPSRVGSRMTVAVVTGGIKGIGYAMSRRLVKLGYQVVALYREDDATAQAMSAELSTLRVDLSDPDAVAEAGRTI